MSAIEANPVALYTRNEVAVSLRQSLSFVKSLIRTGQLAAVRTGGSERHPRGVRVTHEALQAYLQLLPVLPPSAKKGGAA